MVLYCHAKVKRLRSDSTIIKSMEVIPQKIFVNSVATAISAIVFSSIRLLVHPSN
jgi:hypothetical protein